VKKTDCFGKVLKHVQKSLILLESLSFARKKKDNQLQHQTKINK